MQENDIFEGMPTVESDDDLHTSGNLSSSELGQLTKDVDDIKRFLLSEKRPNETACDEIGMIKELVIGVLVPLLTGISELGKLGSLGNLGSLGALGNLGNLGCLGQLGDLGKLGQLPHYGPPSSISAFQNSNFLHNHTNTPFIPGPYYSGSSGWPY